MTPEERREEFKKWALTQPKNDKGATYAENTINGYSTKISNAGSTYPAINNLSYPGNLFECTDRNIISTIRNAISSMSNKDDDYTAALRLYLRFLEPDPLDELIEEYSNAFEGYRNEELYKWEAVKQFQDAWDPDADNFAAMLENALSGTKNLLSGSNYTPKKMLQNFAETNPIKTRYALINLFNEKEDLQMRMKQFEQTSSELLEEYNKIAPSLGKESESEHHQSPRAMSVYLSLRYPEIYYLYMFKIYKKIADKLGKERKKDKFERFADYITICEEIVYRLELNYPKVIKDSDSLLSVDLCAVDPKHHLLAQDILFYACVDSGNENDDSQYMDDEEEEEVKQEIRPGSNIILYGPPGTGKTYNVAAMAWLIFRGVDPTLENVRSLTDEQRVEAKTWYDAELADHENGHIAFTTFHQSYGYEEFIEGIRPVISESNDLEVENDIGYALEDGVFKTFCNRASEPDANGEPYIFVVDEINRGNISKVFGELITLIEPSKRIGQPDQQTVILPYTKKSFGVPANVTIIGTMNTADRSIALMDTALRRRFRFIEMMPDYDALQRIPEFDGINISKLVECVNRRISVLYDREHTIGHAYFMELVEDFNINTLATIFEERIIPLLQEYFYNDYEKICLVLGDNQKNDDSIKFFVEVDSYASDELFGATVAYDDVCSYQMNRKALDDPQAYISIYSQV